MTQLENLVITNPKWRDLPENSDKNAKQRILDEITEEVVSGLTAQDICDHTREVYDATAEEYAVNSHNVGVIDQLIEFMDMVPRNSWILELGFGTGRDALFMSVGNSDFRKSLMTRKTHGIATLEKYPAPPDRQVFSVLALDQSYEMCKYARAWGKKVAREYPQSISNPVIFKQSDIHQLDRIPQDTFDGVWSCAALFTHTPKALLEKTIESISWRLNSGGIFFASYTNGLVEGCYDKLLLSSTGQIKYFSQPDPEFIKSIATRCALTMEKESFSDMEVNGKVIKKDLFVSQFFRKL